VDTLAKKFYLKGGEGLNRLKRALVSYFYFEQFSRIAGDKNYNDLLDKRYDNLIASIANRNVKGDIELKGKVKILSWNYDLQVEKALLRYVDLPIEFAKQEFQIFPNSQTFDNFKEEKFDINKFAVFKINGNAYLERNSNMETLFNPYDSKELFSNIGNGEVEFPFIEKYLTWFNGYFLSNSEFTTRDIENFQFAWETKTRQDYGGFLYNAKKVLKNCKVLIVVGYSFPYFNSEIDKQLLSDIWPEEIIIQDNNFDEVQERMLALNPKLIQKLEHFPVNREFKRSTPGNFFPIHHST